MSKIENLILYIINYFQCNLSPIQLGKVKLNKILWFADRAFMYKNYQSLSGGEYIKNPNGPVLKKMDKILKKLEKGGFIKSFKVNKNGFNQISFLCLKEPNLNSFKANEISVVDEKINELATKNARELSKETHDENWQKSKNGDIMPLEDVFLQDIVPASKADIIKDLKFG